MVIYLFFGLEPQTSLLIGVYEPIK